MGDANPAPVDRCGAGASRETRRPLAASVADRPAADGSERRGTRCICDADTLDHIRGLLGHRALVYGDIGYNKGGEITIQVEQFQLLRARDELPQPHDLRGIFAKSAVTAGDHAD